MESNPQESFNLMMAKIMEYEIEIIVEQEIGQWTVDLQEFSILT